jgi:hypothetical protein
MKTIKAVNTIKVVSWCNVIAEIDPPAIPLKSGDIIVIPNYLGNLLTYMIDHVEHHADTGECFLHVDLQESKPAVQKRQSE